jgi:hypothetical protein
LSNNLEYSLIGLYREKVEELIANKKYKDSNDFIKTAIEILLTWESKHPAECMEVMKTLRPFTPEQEAMIKMTMNPEEIKKFFGQLDIDKDDNEAEEQKILAQRDDDHLKLRDNYQHAKKYVQALKKISKPKDVIAYDGYPLLFNFYSRLLPVKIVINVLGHLMETDKSEKIDLKKLRLNAYDVAEEISTTLSSYEKKHNTPRNKKMSTGLPKKGSDEQDKEKIAMAQKRFKDQYIGKIRKSRASKTEHFEGAPVALGLVYATYEGDTTFVSLTEDGKKFFLMESEVIQGNYDKGPISKEEQMFILEHLIPKLELENMFVNKALEVIEKHDQNNNDKKITQILDEQFYNIAIQFNKENADSVKAYNLNHLDSLENDATKRKITSWRVATMGRLAEMKKVEWTIDKSGDSVYKISK